VLWRALDEKLDEAAGEAGAHLARMRRVSAEQFGGKADSRLVATPRPRRNFQKLSE